MTREEARFHEILLIAGMNDRIGPEIQRMLEEDESLSNLALELSAAGSEPKRQLAALHRFTLDQPMDMDEVALLIRQDLRGRLDSGQMDAEDCMRAMEALAAASEHELEEPWQTMSQFYYFYCEAGRGLISMENLLKCFQHFLEDGTPLTSPYAAPSQDKRKVPRLKKMRDGLKRFFG